MSVLSGLILEEKYETKLSEVERGSTAVTEFYSLAHRGPYLCEIGPCRQ